ncbi:TetR/AcrR family transcriptional regulator [Bifidobacterium sp.]|jgi:AcrR family transcriptional regulator|uniref:TetR/AcrR family transcriptional regulator n=1 Tax=Bifidobacterium sp. TaxID=41200 RepID=UPI0025C541CD|nr:TetR/AcrR family transcriptional regulator [Bifidobacterium sp.]MCH4209316.1 TetR/AcrR family transcriptional regulator [Bifidobacterium sp.]MCI1224110.1 TetR/AcrR family transcriptional regulator [Bifidobacterium sp.]
MSQQLQAESGSDVSGHRPHPLLGAEQRQGEGDTKGERTRNRILDAALRLFSRSGSNGVSLRAIAKEADISHAGLLKYFADKDELILAAIARRDHFPAALEIRSYNDVGPEDYLPLFLEAIEHNMSNPGVVGMFAKVAAEATNPEHPAHDYFKTRYAQLTDKLAQSIRFITGCTQSEARERAEEFIAFVDGIQIQWLLRPDEVNMFEAAKSYLHRTGLPDGGDADLSDEKID